MQLAVPVNEWDEMDCEYRVEPRFLYFKIGRTGSYAFKSGTNAGMCEQKNNSESEAVLFEPPKQPTYIFCKIHQFAKEVIVYLETRVLAHFQNSSSEFS